MRLDREGKGTGVQIVVTHRQLASAGPQYRVEPRQGTPAANRKVAQETVHSISVKVLLQKSNADLRNRRCVHRKCWPVTAAGRSICTTSSWYVVKTFILDYIAFCRRLCRRVLNNILSPYWESQYKVICEASQKLQLRHYFLRRYFSEPYSEINLKRPHYIHILPIPSCEY